MDKMPGQMLDSSKWKSTDVDHIVDGRSYSYQAEEPKMIIHKSHNIEKALHQIILKLASKALHQILVIVASRL
jgi:hypothetical protein